MDLYIGLPWPPICVECATKRQEPRDGVRNGVKSALDSWFRMVWRLLHVKTPENRISECLLSCDKPWTVRQEGIH